MSLPRLALPGLALATVLLACGQAAPSTEARPPAPSAAAPSPIPAGAQTGGRLILGIEYAYPQAAAVFRDSGATSAKPYPDLGAWGHVQSGPGAAFDWRTTDAFVQAYQQADFPHLTLMLRSLADWAAIDPPVKLLHRGDSFPKPEYEDDYAAYVSAMVERYDADGVDDMPGLRTAVTLFGFEPEYSTFWPGDAESYVHLLQLAYPAVKAANPQAQVMAAGLLMTDVFSGSPDAAEVRLRLADPDRRVFDKTPADISLLLDHPEVFDIVDFHALGHYTEIPATVDWLRSEMAARGYSKPIWIGDSWGGAGLNGWGPAACPAGPKSGLLEYPATEADRCAIAATLAALANGGNPDHAAAIEWIRAESAAGVVRKVVLAAAEGLAGINIGNVEDWETMALTLGGAGTAGWQGMIDRNMLTKEFLAYRPAYYALRQVASVIASYTDVTRLDLGDRRLFAFSFTSGSGESVIVAWADSGLWLPRSEAPALGARMPVDASSSLQLEWTVTVGDQPLRRQSSPVDGGLELELGPVPVFIRSG